MLGAGRMRLQWAGQAWQCEEDGPGAAPRMVGLDGPMTALRTPEAKLRFTSKHVIHKSPQETRHNY
jgi:hypothetical protein